jgi:hypothetical protein
METQSLQDFFTELHEVYSSIGNHSDTTAMDGDILDSLTSLARSDDAFSVCFGGQSVEEISLLKSHMIVLTT